LEDIFIKLGLDPNDVNAVEEISKRRNLDIQELRKKLQLPTTKHP